MLARWFPCLTPYQKQYGRPRSGLDNSWNRMIDTGCVDSFVRNDGDSPEMLHDILVRTCDGQ